MTAAERVSTLQFQPYNKESFIDIRKARLGKDSDTDTDYNPRQLRSPKTPISTWMAYFVAIRTMLGPGLLIMPLTVSVAGILAGPCIIIGTGLLQIHTHLLLLESLNEVSRRLKIPYISYRYGFRLAVLHGPPILRHLGEKGPTIIATFMILSHLGICTSTLIMTADSLRDILMVDKSLVNPKVMLTRFGVIRVTIGVPTVMSTILGILGYWAFGTMDENILRALPFDDKKTWVCMGLYMITVALTYPLQCYPAVSVIQELIKYKNATAEPPSDEVLEIIGIIARPAFVITTFTVAMIAPYQAPIVAFVGNLCTTTLSLVFPALMDIGLRYPYSYGHYRLILFKDIAIVLLGVLGWLIGVVFCLFLIYVRVLASNSINNCEYL